MSDIHEKSIHVSSRSSVASGASAMIVEHSPFGRRGYYASYTLQGVQAGQIIAAAVFLPLSAILPPEAFQSWGWRIPFLLSAFVVVAGYIIRRRVDETPAFLEEEAHDAGYRVETFAAEPYGHALLLPTG